MLPKFAFILAAFLGSSLAQTPAGCIYHFEGFLATRSQMTEQETNVGTVHGVNRLGPDHHLDPLLVTSYSNKTALAPQTFEFWSCSSLNGHPYPPGYSAPQSEYVNIYFGILRPKGDTRGCMALTSGGDDNNNDAGARNTVAVTTECTVVEERFRSWMAQVYSYRDSDDAVKLFYADANHTKTIGNTSHGELVLVRDDEKAGVEAMDLLLVLEYL